MRRLAAMALGALALVACNKPEKSAPEPAQTAGATIDLQFDKMLDVARQLGFEPTYRHVALGWQAAT